MNELSSITFALFLALLGGAIAKRLSYPRIVGQLCASLILGIPIIHGAFTEASLSMIAVLAELGIIFLLLLTGFELDINEFKKNHKEAKIIAIFAAAIPFMCGMLLAQVLGQDPVTGLVLGACMAVTAEGATVAILIEMNLIKTRVANIMLGAGILDDFFEIIFLSMILFLSHKDTTGAIEWVGASKILLFGCIAFLAFKLIPILINLLRKQTDQEVSLFGTMLGLGLLMAVLSEWAGTGAILGAFIAGILLQKSLFDPETREHESKSLNLFVFAFIIPFFFFHIGINFDYHSLIDNPTLTLAITGVAVIGKIGGTLLAYPWVNLSLKQLHLIGWGMNSRGVMELVLAGIALENELISTELYSAIVFMAIFTTICFPFVLRNMIRKNPEIMN